MITWSVRHVAASATLAALLAFGAPAAAQTYSPGYKFLQAVEKKDISEVEKMLGQPGSTLINSRDITTGRTALHIAAERRDNVWLVFLANKGANPNIADNHGLTPLMLASQLGFFEGVQTLITAGAHVDDANQAGETPLISAVHRRDTQMMRVLLLAGADPDRADNSGRTAREYAELDGADSRTMAEIERSARAPAGRAANAGEVYGPR